MAVAYADFYARLDSREGIETAYMLAIPRDRRTKHISAMHFVNKLEGQMLTEGSDMTDIF